MWFLLRKRNNLIVKSGIGFFVPEGVAADWLWLACFRCTLHSTSLRSVSFRVQLFLLTTKYFLYTIWECWLYKNIKKIFDLCKFLWKMADKTFSALDKKKLDANNYSCSGNNKQKWCCHKNDIAEYFMLIQNQPPTSFIYRHDLFTLSRNIKDVATTIMWLKLKIRGIVLPI